MFSTVELQVTVNKTKHFVMLLWQDLQTQSSMCNMPLDHVWPVCHNFHNYLLNNTIFRGRNLAQNMHFGFIYNFYLKPSFWKEFSEI